MDLLAGVGAAVDLSPLESTGRHRIGRASKDDGVVTIKAV
jgi:hypothetical protein